MRPEYKLFDINLIDMIIGYTPQTEAELEDFRVTSAVLHLYTHPDELIRNIDRLHEMYTPNDYYEEVPELLTSAILLEEDFLDEDFRDRIQMDIYDMMDEYDIESEQIRWEEQIEDVIITSAELPPLDYMTYMQILYELYKFTWMYDFNGHCFP